MTFDELVALKPATWIQQKSTKKIFVRMVDEHHTDKLGVDEMNVVRGGFIALLILDLVMLFWFKGVRALAKAYNNNYYLVLWQNTLNFLF